MARGDLTLISVSRAGDHGRQIAVWRLSSLIFRLWLHPFSKTVPFAAVFLSPTFFAGSKRCLSVVPLWDLTPIGQQGCLPVASELFL